MEKYFAILDALVDLMAPLVEVVMHDLATNKIVYIKGVLSSRSVGDEGNLDLSALHKEWASVQQPYPKTNFDGRLIKSISVPILSGTQATHLICINYDISLFVQIEALASSLTKVVNEQPKSLFENDWTEKIQTQIYSFIQKKKWDSNILNTAKKKEIIAHLYTLGAFQEKKSTDHIAKILRMGRATIFNYLRELRR